MTWQNLVRPMDVLQFPHPCNFKELIHDPGRWGLHHGIRIQAKQEFPGGITDAVHSVLVLPERKFLEMTAPCGRIGSLSELDGKTFRVLRYNHVDFRKNPEMVAFMEERARMFEGVKYDYADIAAHALGTVIGFASFVVEPLNALFGSGWRSWLVRTIGSKEKNVCSSCIAAVYAAGHEHFGDALPRPFSQPQGKEAKIEIVTPSWFDNYKRDFRETQTVRP